MPRIQERKDTIEPGDFQNNVSAAYRNSDRGDRQTIIQRPT